MSYRKFHRLRVRLAEMDITQQEAARMAGLAPSTLTTRMTGPCAVQHQRGAGPVRGAEHPP